MKTIGRICLVICISFSFILFFYPSLILSWSVEWLFKSYVSHYLGETLYYDAFSLEGNRLIIQQPHLQEKERFSAHSLILQCRVNVYKRRLDVIMTLDQPVCRLPADALDWDHLQTLFDPKKLWFNINPKLNIRDGLLKYALPDQPDSYLYFNMEGDKKTGGRLHVQLDDSQLTRNAFTMQIFKQADSLLFKWDYQDVQGSSLMKLIHVLFPRSRSWSISSGILKGSLTTAFPSHGRPDVQGEVVLENLAFSHLASHVNGLLKAACLKVEKDIILDLVQPAKLTCLEDNHTHWQLDQVVGQIQLDHSNIAQMAFQAQCHYQEHVSQFDIIADVDLNATPVWHIDLTAFCASKNQPKGWLHIDVNSDTHLMAKMACQKLSYVEAGFFQQLLSTFWPVFRSVELQGGVFNALMHVDRSQGTWGAWHLHDVEAQGLKFKILPWQAIFRCHACKGNGAIDWNVEDVWDSLNADLSIESGQIKLEELNAELYSFTDIETHLCVQQGILHRSMVKLQLAGLKGILDVEWGGGKELLALDLQGNLIDAAELLPTPFQNVLKHSFQSNQLHIATNIKRKNRQLDLEGMIHVSDPLDSVQTALIHFGCELKGNLKDSYQPIGWFHAKEIALETFISPFIFRRGQLTLSGIGEFKGSFDRQSIEVVYDAKDLTIENEQVLIELKQLPSSPANQLVGTHHFNLNAYSHDGSLPIRNASYLDKQTGLLFSEISGLLVFENQTVHLTSLEAFYQDLSFTGTLDIDYQDPAPGVFTIHLACPSFYGKVSQVQFLLSHLKEQTPVLEDIPLEGDIEGRLKGIALTFHFAPHLYQLEGSIQGAILNGSIPIHDSNVTIQGLCADFNYEHKQKLEFKEIQGTLLVGKSQQVEEYALAGHYVGFHPLQKEVTFDIWANHQQHQFFRLVGQIQESLDASKLEVHLDKALSHFAHIHPDEMSMTLKDWTTIADIQLKAPIDFTSLLPDLACLSRTGLLVGFLHVPKERVAFEHLQGQAVLEINYSHSLDLLSYQLIGKEISWAQKKYQNFLLKGKKQSKKWIIDQLRLDKLSLYAEIEYRPDQWKVDFLGLSYGKSLLLGLEGYLCPEKKSFEAKVNLCEVHLDYLEEWEPLKPLAASYFFKGYGKGVGQLTVELLAEAPWYRIQSDLQLSMPQIEVRKCLINFKEPLRFHFCSNQALTLQQLNMVFTDFYQELASFSADTIHYDSHQNSLACPSLAIQLPCKHVEKMVAKIHDAFPEWMNHQLQETLCHLKATGEIQATAGFHISSDDYSLTLNLEEGSYTFKKRNYELRGFQLDLRPSSLHFLTTIQEGRCLFSGEGHSNWPALDHGELVLRELASPHVLRVDWTHYAGQNFKIHSMHGHFCGLDMALDEEVEALMPFNSELKGEYTTLKGRLVMDINRMIPLFNEEIGAKMRKLKLGSSYVAQGNWWMNFQPGQSLLETLHFQGRCESQNLVIKGCQFDKMQADVSYGPHSFTLKNLIIEDAAGLVQCSHLTLAKNESTHKWIIQIPYLAIRNFRPHLLKKGNETESSSCETLCIRRFNLYDFQGEWEDSSTWRAVGDFYFLNPARRTTSHPLLTLPAEIILHLGLNPKVLSPIMGTIYFAMQGERLYLKKFKDVYSEGRASKFYLAHNTSPSWIDLKGNLFIHIRMKQYNLVFKIAELFTLSIQGNLKKPKYSLQKID